MILEKTDVHEKNENGSRRDIAQGGNNSQKTQKGVSRDFAVWRKLAKDLSRQSAPRKLAKNPNKYHVLNIHLIGELSYCFIWCISRLSWIKKGF